MRTHSLLCVLTPNFISIEEDLLKLLWDKAISSIFLMLFLFYIITIFFFINGRNIVLYGSQYARVVHSQEWRVYYYIFCIYRPNFASTYHVTCVINHFCSWDWQIFSFKLTIDSVLIMNTPVFLLATTQRLWRLFSCSSRKINVVFLL